jgi:amino acid adenylation domain-containing protein
MLEDCVAPVVLTQTHLRERLPVGQDGGCDLLCLDDPALVVDQPEHSPERRSGPAHLAYIIYTSGSTGRPKGVMISHGALRNFLRDMGTRIDIGARDRLLAVTTVAFDIAALELYLPLIHGAGIRLATRAEASDPTRLGYCLDASITHMQATPATWRMLLDSGWCQASPLTVLCGGEALPSTLGEALRAQSDRLWNLYGPTETTIWSTAHDASNDKGDPGWIGRPIANTRIHILDRHLQPVPIGIPGELCIAGAGLARGYLNRPELTAEKFIDLELFGRRERIYRTGDLARWRADGNLEYLGRLDHQVKLRGFRIELGEIEAVLAQHPAVREAAVVLHARDADKALAAYLVPAADAAEQDGAFAAQPQAALRDWLKARLPDYMVPASFTLLEAFPLTPNGKLDRKALPEPEADRLVAGEQQAPRDYIELALTQLWEAVLDVRPIGVHASFFELGGHSLLAVKLMAGIERTLGRRLPLAALFEAPTIAELARRLADGASPRAAPHLVAIQPAGSQVPLYCLPGAGGHVLRFHPLSVHLGREQPVFGLETPGVDGSTALPASVPAHAEVLLASLRRHRPHGPYRLAGYSSGGKVAFELARRLEVAGETVTELVIFDTAPDADPAGLAELQAQSELDWSWQMLDALQATYGVDLGLEHERVAGADLDPAALRRQVAERAEALGVLSAAEVALFEARFAVMRRSGLNHAAYACDAVLDCPIVLFRAEDEAPGQQDVPDDPREDWGWQARSRRPGLVHWVPGHHGNMLMGPQVKTLAALLQQRLVAPATPERLAS